jgi:hypothetical protein
MSRSVNDLTNSEEWLAEQERRLLGFEVLRAFALPSRGVAMMDPGTIAEKTGSDKGDCHRILQRLAADPALKAKLTRHG